jgi:hypothetical protein
MDTKSDIKSDIKSIESNNHSKLFKIIFKDNLSTVLPYGILCRFEMIKVLMDESKSNVDTITLPSLDINIFMSVLYKIFEHSKKFTYNIISSLDTKEKTLYDYLITDDIYIKIINNTIKDLLKIIKIFIEIYFKYNTDDYERYEVTISNLIDNGFTSNIIDIPTKNKNETVGCISCDYDTPHVPRIYLSNDYVGDKYNSIFNTTSPIVLYKGPFLPLKYDVIITSTKPSDDDDLYIDIKLIG